MKTFLFKTTVDLMWSLLIVALFFTATGIAQAWS